MNIWNFNEQRISNQANKHTKMTRKGIGEDNTCRNVGTRHPLPILWKRWICFVIQPRFCLKMPSQNIVWTISSMQNSNKLYFRSVGTRHVANFVEVVNLFRFQPWFCLKITIPSLKFIRSIQNSSLRPSVQKILQVVGVSISNFSFVFLCFYPNCQFWWILKSRNSNRNRRCRTERASYKTRSAPRLLSVPSLFSWFLYVDKFVLNSGSLFARSYLSSNEHAGLFFTLKRKSTGKGFQQSKFHACWQVDSQFLLSILFQNCMLLQSHL